MDKVELREIICDTLQIKKTTPMIEKQMNKYAMELGLSYKEIAQAIVFYIEVQKGKYEPKYGIAIVPYVIEDARYYFKKLKEEREKQIKSVKEANKNPDIILNVTKIRKRRKLKKINIDEIDVD